MEQIYEASAMMPRKSCISLNVLAPHEFFALLAPVLALRVGAGQHLFQRGDSLGLV